MGANESGEVCKLDLILSSKRKEMGHSRDRVF